LSGSIPLGIGNLISLEELSIGSNVLYGPISTSLGGLTNLTLLYLYNNKLSGSIPPEIGNLISLQNLSIRSNVLFGLSPTSLGHLTNLTHLYLYKHKLSGLSLRR